MKSNKAVVKVLPPQREKGSIASYVEQMLLQLGEDPARDGLQRIGDQASVICPLSLQYR